MAKQGRPRGLNLNPAAVEDGLARAHLTRSELCAAVGITPGHLADALGDRRKGVAVEMVEAIATKLGTRPAVIAPSLSGRFLDLRPGDDVAEAELAS